MVPRSLWETVLVHDMTSQNPDAGTVAIWIDASVCIAAEIGKEQFVVPGTLWGTRHSFQRQGRVGGRVCCLYCDSEYSKLTLTVRAFPVDAQRVCIAWGDIALHHR